MFDYPMVASSIVTSLMVFLIALTSMGLYMHVHLVVTVAMDYVWAKLERRYSRDTCQRSVPVQGPRP